MRVLLAALVAVPLSGCVITETAVSRSVQEGAQVALLQPQPPRKGQSGGVMALDAPWTLTTDSRAFRPGDILTVLLQETTQASKKADTSFGKSSGGTFAPLTLGNKNVTRGLSFEADREFAGSASSSQQNLLRGAVTVIVLEVLPNGLLRVEGEKTIKLNQGEEFVRLSGYVRASDIASDNSVSSQRVANARITYSGHGALADANEAGWLTRLFTGPWMPF